MIDDPSYINNQKYDFYFSFPSKNFDKQTQEQFITNFKNNPFFKENNFTVIEKGMNFTSYYSYNNHDYNSYNNVIRQVRFNVFENEDTITKYYKDHYDLDEYNSKSVSFIGIVFTSLTQYFIRFKYSNDNELYEELKNTHGYPYKSQIKETFVSQVLVDKALIQTLVGSSNYKNYNVTETWLERGMYSMKITENIIQDYLPLFMLFYFVPCIGTLLNQLVIEKESKIKESLIIIGLKKSSFWTSWAVTYGTIIVITSILVTIAMIYSHLFSYISFSILIIVMLIYGLSCCCISFILSTLIEKSKTANTVGVMIIVAYFVMYFVNMAVEKMVKTKWFCIYTISPISFLSLFNYLISLEKQGLNFGFFSMLKNDSTRCAFFGLLFTLIFYFLLAIYLDNVIPQGNNFHKKWHFFITDFFQKKKEKIIEKDSSNKDNPYIQNDPENLRKAVEVKNVGKSFKVKGENIEILNSISFNGYYDEIFCILGHNGAGKTTLMSIMTGILSSTHGEVYYDNIPITGNEIEVCTQFGYCPQFDTFNNNLTVGEHVKLFAGIKGIKVKVKEILKDIDLLEKKDNFPKELSGGQKRKLCITLALLGSPKFIFLDEPTTGLDPYSRKNIWELLSRKKKDCIMFVTTHYMDEADLLADRKMIISNGNITCLGSSLFLKNSFNMNYSLDIHIKEANDSLCIDDTIEKYCPGSVKTKTITNSNVQVHNNDESSTSTTMTEDCIATYLLPIKYSKTFKEIFLILNQFIKDENNGIKNFSLTAPTLEELFVKLENNDGNPEIQNIKKTTVINMEGNNDEILNKLNPIFGQTLQIHSSSLMQIYNIAKIRIKTFIRNKTFALLYTLLPICLVIISIYFVNVIIKVINEPKTYESLEITPSLYQEVEWFKDTTSTGKGLEVVNLIEKTNGVIIKSVDYANELTIASGKLTSNLNYAAGIKGFENDHQELQFIIYNNSTYLMSVPVAINMLDNAILKYYNIDKKISVTLKPFDLYYEKGTYDEDDDQQLFDLSSEYVRIIIEPILIVAMAIAISLSVSIYGPLTVKEREEGINHQLLLNGTKRINYWIGILISDMICLISPVLLISIAGMINEISIFNIKVIPYTLIATIVWVFTSLFHQYIASYFFKKYERVSSLFIIINPILTLFIGIYCMVVALITSISIYDFGNNTDDKLAITQYKFYLILALFAPASIVLYFSKLSTFIILKRIDISQGEIISFLSSETVSKIFADESLSNSEKIAKLTKAFFSYKIPSFFDIITAKDNFLLLIFAAIILLAIYILIIFILEKINIKKIKKNREYTLEERKELDHKLEKGPTDVLNEWKKVRSTLDGSNPNSNIALKVFQLNKDFSISIKKMLKLEKKSRKKKNGFTNDDNRSAFQRMDDRTILDKKKKIYINRIVDDVSFGVHVGECLGLLGPNGAGKTTSISMITGLLSHTHGKIVYGNKDLNETEMCDLSLGYCSQLNALWNLLTVKETIQFYLNICGYPKSDIPNYTKALIEACGIENHTNKKVNEISGGTKRKLSLIVAICSSPSYLILDEPSAGMDPFTRRYMWKLILELKKVRATSTILTTHSTEEAEALCERIAILIKGRLVCVDTPKSIKMNHSNNYTLEVFTDDPQKFEEEYVKNKNLFGIGPDEKYNLESSISYQKYSVKMKTENIADVFAIMEMAKESGLVSQYNFGQYSLEQVFINFVNQSE